MAKDAGSVRPGLLAALPYVLTVAGGLCGVALVNVTQQGSPLFGIVVGAVLGWIVASGLTRLIERKSASGFIKPAKRD